MLAITKQMLFWTKIRQISSFFYKIYTHFLWARQILRYFSNFETTSWRFHTMHNKNLLARVFFLNSNCIRNIFSKFYRSSRFFIMEVFFWNKNIQKYTRNIQIINKLTPHSIFGQIIPNAIWLRHILFSLFYRIR